MKEQCGRILRRSSEKTRGRGLLLHDPHILTTSEGGEEDRELVTTCLLLMG
jgi:hypothetical protein